EGTRSLDAPTNVNTGQITRCSCPFGQTERYRTPGRADKAFLHDFHRRCLAVRGVVHTVSTRLRSTMTGRFIRSRDQVASVASPASSGRSDHPSHIAQAGTSTPEMITNRIDPRSSLPRLNSLTATPTIRAVAVTHDQISHAPGMSRRKVDATAKMPIPARTEAAATRASVAPLASICAQIWATISVSLKPQSQ